MKENAPLPLVEELFYPSDSGKLTEMVDKFLKDKNKGKSSILWIPHAAYDLCGELMGKAFSSAANSSPERIILLLPVHREPAEILFFSSCRNWNSPVGSGILDTETALELDKKYTFCQINDIPFEEENSFELPLPFIYHLYGEIRILPVFIGSKRASFLKKGADVLKDIYNAEKDIIIISGNSSKYEQDSEADRQKNELIRVLHEKKEILIPESLDQKKIATCGAPAIYMLVRAGILSPGELKLTDHFFAADPSSVKPRGVWFSAGSN